MKKEIKNLSTSTVNQKFLPIYKATLSYCLKSKKIQKLKTKKKNTKNGRIMLSSKCTVSDSKKLRFIKEQEAGL